MVVLQKPFFLSALDYKSALFIGIERLLLSDYLDEQHALLAVGCFDLSLAQDRDLVLIVEGVVRGDNLVCF